jgi:ABC-2 type transport system ATP-binding protein
MSNAIELRGVCKSYRIYDRTPQAGLLKKAYKFFNPDTVLTPAVSALDLTVADGEFVGLIGPNGAGKTTTIKMMTGILTPDAGTVSVLGFSPSLDRKRYTKHIGLVMGQKSLLWYNIPVIETLKLYKEIYSVSDSSFKESVAYFSELFAAEQLLAKPVRHLSLGERMRAELMASLLHKPKVLFLDEPTIGLDVLSRHHFLEHLQKINADYKTSVVLTSHNMHDIEKLCSRVVIVDKGRKIHDGSVAALLDRDAGKKFFSITKSGEAGSLSAYISGASIEVLHDTDKGMKISIAGGEYKKYLSELIMHPGVSSISEDTHSLEEVIIGIYKGGK